MNAQQAGRTLRTMTSGECRWIGREDIHAYAFGSREAGRFDAKALVFRLVTAGRPFEGQAWMGCDEAAAMVAAMTEQADSLRVQAGECEERFQLEGSDMAKKTSKKTVSKADKRRGDIVKGVAKLLKAERTRDASKARVAEQLTDAAAKAGIVRVKRPSIVVKEIVEREGLRNTSYQYEIENVVDHKGKQSWFVKLQGFFVTEFDSIAAAKKVYPNARIVGGQGCAEAVEGRPEPVVEEPKPVEKPKAEKAQESPEDRLARLKAAARKAWETRKANGWKHPKAKPAFSPDTADLMKRADEQLAQSKANVKQARETFKAIEAKKAEKRKALAVVKRVEKREADKRKGQQIGGIKKLQQIMGEAIGLT